MQTLAKARLNKQVVYLRGYFAGMGFTQSQKAMELVLRYHKGERKDGSPEASHLLEVATIVLGALHERSNSSDLDEIVAAALLHDLVEDYSRQYSENALRMDFNLGVCQPVMNVCKPADFKKTREYREAYFRKIQSCPRSIIVKGADRLHNIRSMVNGFPVEKRELYILEVEEWFYPMMKFGERQYPEFKFVIMTLRKTIETELEMIKRINQLEKETKKGVA